VTRCNEPTADATHRRLAGVSRSTEGIYQFVDEERPDFIDPTCVIHVYEYVVPPEGGRRAKIRVLHSRCPILGIGGTKVGGGGSGEEGKFISCGRWSLIDSS
jgi:hypothetical protein